MLCGSAGRRDREERIVNVARLKILQYGKVALVCALATYVDDVMRLAELFFLSMSDLCAACEWILCGSERRRNEEKRLVNFTRLKV